MAFDAFGPRGNTGTALDTYHRTVGGGGLWLTVILSFVIFAFDVWLNFARTGSYLTQFGLLYFFLGFLIWYQLRSAGVDGTHAFWAVARRWFFAFLAPFLLVAYDQSILLRYESLFGQGAFTIFMALLTSKYLPLLLLFWGGFAHWSLDQAARSGGRGSGFASGVNIVLVLAVLLSILLPIFESLEASGRFEQSGTYEVPGFGDMFKDIVGVFKRTWDTAVQGASTRVNGSIAAVTQPYYTGQVERQQGLPLGVFIREQRAILPVFTYDRLNDTILPPGDRAVTWFGEVQARTFSAEFPVELSCLYEVSDVEFSFPARPDRFAVHYTGDYAEEFPFSCEIPMADLPHADARNLTGRFSARANFSFSTWGYTTLTFMDRDFMTALRRDNVEPARYLGIDPRPVARYTPGPVGLGMETVPQPLGISTNPDRSSQTNFLPSFGVTLSNAWSSQGEITHLHALVLQVPQPLELDTQKCSGLTGGRQPRVLMEGESYDATNQFGEIEQVDDDYVWYLFEDIDLGEASYKTIQCPLIVRDWSALLGPDLTPRQYTLVARAAYDYMTEANAPVRVGLEQRT